jgi:hypothetical protein
VDPVPDPLLLRKCVSAGNRTEAVGNDNGEGNFKITVIILLPNPFGIFVFVNVDYLLTEYFGLCQWRGLLCVGSEWPTSTNKRSSEFAIVSNGNVFMNFS